MEEWRKIKDFEYYEVSNKGNIRSLDRIVNHNFGGKAIKKGKILKKDKKALGYLGICLVRDKKCYKKLIHRLVAQAFIPNPNNLLQVNHIDGNKENNNVNNLEWCTAKENENHARTTNLKNMISLIENIKKANSKRISIIINNKVLSFKSKTECAKYFNISLQMLNYNIKHNKIKIL